MWLAPQYQFPAKRNSLERTHVALGSLTHQMPHTTLSATDAQPGTTALPPALQLPLRILVVEDVAVQRRLLARTLSNMGHVVESASDGQQALAMLLASAFDVLITDWEMPGMDGPTLCAAVRASKLERYMFIIMLTSHDSVNDFVAGIGSGADAYVRKPANTLELQAHLTAGRRIVQLERELRAAKATDSFLNIYTRDYLDEQLPREIERAQRYEQPLTLVMADLDEFKRINDLHGHSAGDLALRCFCNITRECIRAASDWIARYGGDEFAIVLPQTDLTGAASVAEKVRTGCASNPIAGSPGPLAFTVSLGVVDLPPANDRPFSAAQMLQRADSALYQSKRDGRNRVTVWHTG
jgi:two-component system cell cycle response regulator